jgi:holliday junction DNA helicase RuvA
MLALISGQVAQLHEASAVIDCHGVGYELLCSSRTLSRLQVGQPARLLTHLHVREDALVLFGFADAAEKQLFTMVTSVSGVGPKLGLSLLSTLGPDEIVSAIQLNQPASLARASGVGKKLAENIVVNLRDKVGALAFAAAPVSGSAQGHYADLISALANLGYQPKVAEAAAQAALRETGAAAADFATLFKHALRHVGTAA